jgi:hypothetical protein
MRNKYYGARFVDSTVWIDGDREFCVAIHGEVATDRCHLEGWSKRLECELELLGLYADTDEACPIWQFKEGRQGAPQVCHDQRSGVPVSCDHFGNTQFRDDPQTPTTGDTLETLQGFEGEPKVCGLDRDAYGPRAGFGMVPHQDPGVVGFVRACRPDGDGCGRWTKMR